MTSSLLSSCMNLESCISEVDPIVLELEWEFPIWICEFDLIRKIAAVEVLRILNLEFLPEFVFGIWISCRKLYLGNDASIMYVLLGFVAVRD